METNTNKEMFPKLTAIIKMNLFTKEETICLINYMRETRKVFVSILSALTLINASSCKLKEEGDREGNYQMKIDETFYKEKIPLSTFVDSIGIIRLETTDQSLLAKANAIKFYLGNIYILDPVTNKITVFSKTGKYLKSLDKQGLGSGEYISITDFDIADSKIYVLDLAKKSILIYDLDFKYIDKKNFSSAAINIAVSDEFIFLCNAFGQSSGEDHELLAIKGNQTTNISKREIKIQDYEIDNLVCWVDGNVFSSNGGNIYYSDRGSNNVFEIKEGKLVLYSSLDFGKYSFPSDNNISFSESTNYSNNFPYLIKESFFISNRYNIISFYNKNNEIRYVFQNKLESNIMGGEIKNDLINNYNRFLPRFSSENILIKPVNPILLIEPEYSGLKEYFPIVKDATEEDNFILLLYYLKS